MRHNSQEQPTISHFLCLTTLFLFFFVIMVNEEHFFQ